MTNHLDKDAIAGRLHKLLALSLALAITMSLAVLPAWLQTADAVGLPRDPVGDVITTNVIEELPSYFDPADFDIRNYGFDDDGNPYVQVYGHAGRTIAPEHEHEDAHAVIYAYALLTNTGIWVLDSHDFEHDEGESNERTGWHGQTVQPVFDLGAGCFDVTSVDSEARVVGKRATVLGADATEIMGALTLQLALVNLPDADPTDDRVCNAVLEQEFDGAFLGTIAR